MSKLIHDRNQCIHCGACVSVCPEFFSEQDKITLNNGTYDADERGVLEIQEDQVPTAQGAVDVCPVACIHLEK